MASRAVSDIEPSDTSAWNGCGDQAEIPIVNGPPMSSFVASGYR